jgi:hypothetical protein
MAHLDETPVAPNAEGKALRPKGTAATFSMEILTSAERVSLDRLRETVGGVAQKKDSSWGGEKTTLNWDCFWFYHVDRLIANNRLSKAGRILPVGK